MVAWSYAIRESFELKLVLIVAVVFRSHGHLARRRGDAICDRGRKGGRFANGMGYIYEQAIACT